MKKLLLLPLLSLQLIAASIYWHDSYKDALEEAKEENKPMLIYMSQSGCKACEMMEDKVLNQENITQYLDDNYICAHLDIHDNDAPKALKVPYTPVFHFLDKDGNVIKESYIGGTKASEFIKVLQLPQT